MRLIVTTPMGVVVDAGDVSSLRAEDESGAFGVLQKHADFLTVLAVSVVSWRDRGGREHYVAVRGGTLAVREGRSIEVATAEAVAGDDLETLETAVLARFREQAGAERVSRAAAARMQLAVIRRIWRYLRPEEGPPARGWRRAGEVEPEP